MVRRAVVYTERTIEYIIFGENIGILVDQEQGVNREVAVEWEDRKNIITGRGVRRVQNLEV